MDNREETAEETTLGHPIHIRARARDGMTEALVLMPHPMESGFRRNARAGVVPAHYIIEVQITVGDRTVLEATLSPAVARDPLLSFRFRGGRPGDPIRVSWVDSTGARRADEATIV